MFKNDILIKLTILYITYLNLKEYLTYFRSFILLFLFSNFFLSIFLYQNLFTIFQYSKKGVINLKIRYFI